MFIIFRTLIKMLDESAFCINCEVEKIHLEIADTFSVKHRNTYVLSPMGCTEDLIVVKQKHLKPKIFWNSFSSYCQIPSATAQVTLGNFTKAHQLLKDCIGVLLMKKLTSVTSIQICHFET